MVKEIQKMGRKDIGQLLESAKFKHLSETMLVSYRDNKLDKIQHALAESHLQRCLICQRRLTFLKNEAEAVANYVLTDEDRAANEKFVRERKPKATDYIKTELKRLASIVEDVEAAWILSFSKVAMRGAGDGDEVWRYKTKRGALTVWAILEKDASLTVHFSSTKLAWEGARLRFQLGTFSKEITLKREGDGVAGKIKIPRSKRPKKMNKLSIEVLPKVAGKAKK
jgi:hypothetical protein